MTLARRVPLQSGKPLERRTPLKPGGGLARVPLQTRRAPASRPKPARRDPGEVNARRVVTARSRGLCEACGAPATDWAHRIARSQGGPWAASNGVHLCRRCHAACHAAPLQAIEVGLILRSWQDPRTVPVKFRDGLWLLDDNGGRTAA